MTTPTPSTGTATPMELDPEQATQSLKVSLADLSARATALYAHKNYEEAAEVYAQAAEMQSEMNGEMSPENGEILFLYGRTLFKIGQAKSDVLGGKAPEAKKQPKSAKTSKPAKPANGSSSHKNGESVAAAAAAEAEAKTSEKPGAEKKGLFHFEGDENFEDSEEEDDGEDGEEEEEDDDDLAIAFEILEIARVLFTKRLEAFAEAETDKGKDVAEGENPTVRHIKERLADTHSLLTEISLENERYPNAIVDSRASLRYKKELYPEESEIIAEAHYKLSLALEFASMTKSSDDDADEAGKESAADKESSGNGFLDQSLRDEAATELEAAIASTKLKLQNKEVELASGHNPDDNDLTRQQITEVKEVIADMEQRLVDLRKPPVDINEALGLPPAGSSALATSKEDEEVKKNANDLTGLVRRKRKVGEAAVGEAVHDGVEAKKVKEGGYRPADE
ncbi:hypothetical protein B0H67DRAFT_643982 [Lasiosphaeris hirsuta]|uniref:Tetratricopeptide SHNi-TPR domain-containing protein n=1 Tax=Lasiosphaeris hirsuta TaxID=260670 RepID=A0AA40DYV7_9PEZI|nr:hypothetical protein B0H67DRAFT_643982 [Lasiosphaeris hirsuta]